MFRLNAAPKSEPFQLFATVNDSDDDAAVANKLKSISIESWSMRNSEGDYLLMVAINKGQFGLVKWILNRMHSLDSEAQIRILSLQKNKKGFIAIEIALMNCAKTTPKEAKSDTASSNKALAIFQLLVNEKYNRIDVQKVLQQKDDEITYLATMQILHRHGYEGSVIYSSQSLLNATFRNYVSVIAECFRQGKIELKDIDSFTKDLGYEFRSRPNLIKYETFKAVFAGLAQIVSSANGNYFEPCYLSSFTPRCFTQAQEKKDVDMLVLLIVLCNTIVPTYPKIIQSARDCSNEQLIKACQTGDEPFYQAIFQKLSELSQTRYIDVDILLKSVVKNLGIGHPKFLSLVKVILLYCPEDDLKKSYIKDELQKFYLAAGDKMESEPYATVKKYLQLLSNNQWLDVKKLLLAPSIKQEAKEEATSFATVTKQFEAAAGALITFMKTAEASVKEQVMDVVSQSQQLILEAAGKKQISEAGRGKDAVSAATLSAFSVVAAPPKAVGAAVENEQPGRVPMP